jgi:hypothetical protein
VPKLERAFVVVIAYGADGRHKLDDCRGRCITHRDLFVVVGFARLEKPCLRGLVALAFP